MNKYYELNLEEGFPTKDEAMSLLKHEIQRAKKNKIECMLIIHGYGSSGKGGGIIRNASRQWLNAQVKNGYIKSITFGERFDLFNATARDLKNKYNQLNQLFTKYNPGVTVIEL